MEVKRIFLEALDHMRAARDISASSWLELSALRWELYAALQNTLDGLAMMLAELSLRKPSSYAELGKPLLEAGLLSEEDEKVARELALTRNVLAHAYRRLDFDDLVKVVKELLPKFEKLARRLLDLTNLKNIDPSRDSLTEKLSSVFAEHGVKFAYLFGSRARGTEEERSDYDLAVFFKDERTIVDELKLALAIAEALNIPSDLVDVIALNKAEHSLIARVLKEGRPIYSDDEAERKKWERRTYLKLLRESDLDALFLARKMFNH